MMIEMPFVSLVRGAPTHPYKGEGKAHRLSSSPVWGAVRGGGAASAILEVVQL